MPATRPVPAGTREARRFLRAPYTTPAKLTLSTGEVLDGRGLNDDEFGYFVMMLAVAGNETTRNAITHGMQAFFDHPDQWELFKEQRPATAADEIVRWATPVVSFQRTATADHVVGGQEIKKGERVGLFYGSANRDESVFTDPNRFDVLRDPNPHVGFGGGGGSGSTTAGGASTGAGVPHRKTGADQLDIG